MATSESTERASKTSSEQTHSDVAAPHPSAGEAPVIQTRVVTLDAVFVTVTPTIARDYTARGVFRFILDNLSATNADVAISAEEADVLLEDARARRTSLPGPLRHAYGSHIRKLERAIEYAGKRRQIYEARAAVQTYNSEYSEEWRGTKEQLKAQGFILEGPWPAEPGGKKRWARATDAAGHDVHITRYSRDQPEDWPILFEAQFDRHDHERPTPSDPERDRKLARALAEVEAMPKDEEEFLWKIVDHVRGHIRTALKIESEAHEYHGYTITEDSVDSIMMQIDDLLEAITEAEVVYDDARQQARRRKLQGEIASLDSRFQQKLKALAKPNPKILEGSPS
jgi:hypothetical protein